MLHFAASAAKFIAQREKKKKVAFPILFAFMQQGEKKKRN